MVGICVIANAFFIFGIQGFTLGRLQGVGGRIETPPRVFATFVPTKVDMVLKRKLFCTQSGISILTIREYKNKFFHHSLFINIELS